MKRLLSLTIILSFVLLNGCNKPNAPVNLFKKDADGNCPCVMSGNTYGPYGGLDEPECIPECCEGLAPVNGMLDEESGICFAGTGGALCLPCGNGICDKNAGEDHCSCPEDCEDKKE
jgi:hypothetical protein